MRSLIVANMIISLVLLSIPSIPGVAFGAETKAQISPVEKKEDVQQVRDITVSIQHSIGLGMDPSSSYGVRSYYFERMGEFKKAESDLNRMVQLAPEIGLKKRAEFFERQGKLEQRDADLRRLKELPPVAHKDATKQIEYWERQLNETTFSQDECKKSIASWLSTRADYYIEQSAFKEAEVDLNRMVEVHPATGLSKRAEFYASRNEIAKAEADYLRTIETSLNDDKWLVQKRAEFFETIDKPEIALKDWERAFGNDPRARLMPKLIRHRKLSERKEKIISQLPKLSEASSKSDAEKWLELTAQADELAHAIDAVVLDCEETLADLISEGVVGGKKVGERSPYKGESIYDWVKKRSDEMGREADRGQDQAIMGMIDGMKKLKKGTQMVRFSELGNSVPMLDRLGMFRQVASALRKMSELKPDFCKDCFDWHVELALAYYYICDLEKAEEMVRLVLSHAKRPKSERNGAVVTEISSDMMFAEILEQQGKFDQAISVIKKAFETGDWLSKPQFFYHARLAKLLSKSGNLPESKRNYDEALKIRSTLDPKSESASIVKAENLLAEIELLNGNYESAAKRVDAYPDTSIKYQAQQILVRANANAKLGKLKEAEADLTRCKGWLEDLPVLGDLAQSAANTISDARGAKFPLNTPVREKFALILGVGSFKDSRIPKLRYAAKDANDVREMLVQDYGFKPANVKILTDEQATKAAVLEALRNKWLPNVAQPDDLVLLFVSSHGTPTHKDIAARNYVVVHDTDRERLYSTSLPMEQICEFLRTKCKARKTLVIADTCYSGGIVKVLPSSVGGDKEGNLNPEDFVLANQMLVVSSSDVNQKSWESKRYSNGVFTRQLIESFKKHRNYSDFKQVFEDLRQSTSKEVKEDENADQSPRLAGGTWTGVEAGQ